MKKIQQWSMPSALTILFGITALMVLLTWFVPGGQYVEEGGELVYHSIGVNPKGLWSVLSAFVGGFFEAMDVGLFILTLGGFSYIVIKTGALERGINALLKKLKGQEEWLIPLLMLLFGLGGTVYGMAEETLAFYAVVIIAFLKAGYDIVVPFKIIFLGAGVGVLASTVNPFATGIASDIAGIPLLEGSLARIVLFVVLQAFVIIWTMRYAKKVKQDKKHSLVHDLHANHLRTFGEATDREEQELSKRDITILYIVGVTFLVLIISLIPWEDFGVTVFHHFFEFLRPIRILGFAHPEEYGQPLPLGEWYFEQLAIWFLIMGVVVGVVARLTEKQISEQFIEGMKDLLGVFVIIFVARGIKVVMDSSGLNATILYYGSQLLGNVSGLIFINLAHLLYLPLSFLIPSTSGLAVASMPILAPLAELVGVGKASIITVFQSAEGVVNMITPTSGVVMGALALAQIPYTRWVSHFIKPLIVIFLISSVIISLDTYLRVLV